MRHTRQMTVFTVDDCVDRLPPELLKSDTDTIRSEISQYLKVDCMEALRLSDSIVFCTPDQQYIGLKHKESPLSALDKRSA